MKCTGEQTTHVINVCDVGVDELRFIGLQLIQISLH